jgi:hypothetical protein
MRCDWLCTVLARIVWRRLPARGRREAIVAAPFTI